jgi:methyl-accepting chemotaxis protein/hemerythrin
MTPCLKNKVLPLLFLNLAAVLLAALTLFLGADMGAGALAVAGAALAAAVVSAALAALGVRRAAAQAAELAGEAARLTREVDGAGAPRAAANEQAPDAALRGLRAAIQARCAETERAHNEALASAREAQAAHREAQAREGELAARNAGITDAAHRAGELAAAMVRDMERLEGLVAAATAGAGSQMERMRDTATAMTQMTAAVMDVARNAGGTSDKATQTMRLSEEGAGVMEGVRAAIATVTDHTAALQMTMQQLGEQARGIGGVISTINDIADQTNLLALNAAIEAARAGDAGRGFAVVADEVRKLAEKTMLATKEVEVQVGSIQSGVARGVEVSEQMISGVGDANTRSGEAREALERIRGMAVATSGSVEAIATASEEQSAASEEIASAVDEVSHIAEQTVEGMRESGAVLHELLGLLDEMGATVQGMTGKAPAGAPARRKPAAPAAPAAARPAPRAASAPRPASGPAAKPRPAPATRGGFPIQWDDAAMSVRVAEIDEQHKVLVSMINELNEAMRSGRGKDALGDMIRGLKDYAAFHFAHEEKLMGSHDYPGLLAHKARHREFVKQVVDFERDFKSGRAALTMEIMQFLKDWLVEHIQGTDRSYSKHLNDRGVR